MTADPTIARWLIDPATRALPVEVALTKLVELLTARGLPRLTFVGMSLPTLHPEVWVRRLTWTRGKGATLRLPQHALNTTPEYLDSPIAAIHAGSGLIRCRLVGPDADLGYGICRELAEEGATDYLCIPLDLGGAPRTYFSLATDDPDGFDEGEIAEVCELSPYLSMWIDFKAAQLAGRGLLEVYLGKLAATRVLAGHVRRGTGVGTHAAIWTCDLRGFTAMSDSVPPSEVVATLDSYFEAVSGPIFDCGGEVLKFIGDAVLAIFPVAEGSRAEVCTQALAAARGALAAMDTLNAAREVLGKPRLGVGIALHVGEVMFGNIGARERLDFTVIGAAVNEVCRMESLCKTLNTPLVVSAAFAAEIGDDVVSLGEQRLRGVADPQCLFTLRAYAPGDDGRAPT